MGKPDQSTLKASQEQKQEFDPKIQFLTDDGTILDRPARHDCVVLERDDQDVNWKDHTHQAQQASPHSQEEVARGYMESYKESRRNGGPPTRCLILNVPG